MLVIISTVVEAVELHIRAKGDSKMRNLLVVGLHMVITGRNTRVKVVHGHARETVKTLDMVGVRETGVRSVGDSNKEVVSLETGVDSHMDNRRKVARETRVDLQARIRSQSTPNVQDRTSSNTREM
jgi:hypothetical protein